MIDGCSAMLRFAILFYLFISSLCEERQSRLVRTSHGPVKGYKDVEEDIYVFYNIPYATAPSGTDRFKAPLPAPIWLNTFEAVDQQIICPQTDMFGIIPDTIQMKENCLISNIYVPETEEINLPVVVYVHGGAYVMGWGELFSPKKLVSSKKVIAVTFNYRLSAHGFLCLGTKDAPGNAGMKDQVALLRWVQKNIASFGGNPDEVTIAGYSAGSSAVDLLAISKMAEGLFKRVIPESGANAASWSAQSDPIYNAKIYAKLLKFDNVDDFYALEEFYKTVPYDLLNSVHLLNRTDTTFVMTPCVESDIGEERFLTDSPVNILKSGNFRKSPMLYGFANMEGLFRAPMFDDWKDLMNNRFSDFLPTDLEFKDDNERELVADQIKRFYFGDGSIENEDVLDYVNYFTDVIFAYPTLRSVKYQVTAGNDQIYLYEYSYVDEDTPYVPHTMIRGANHCAQTSAVLDGYYNGTKVDEKYIADSMKKIKSIMREIWLNFMTTGKPIPEGSSLPVWSPVGADWSPHMSLGLSLKLKGSLLKERTLFWDSIYDKYYRNPLFPTPPSKHTEL